MSTRSPAGSVLREWRVRRRLSQLELSARTGVSTRHLSCVETGRAKPSRELLLYLSDELEIPRRNSNELLLAAGFAPEFTHHDLDADDMAEIREIVQLVLTGAGTSPTTVIDTRWNLIDANSAALWLTAGVAPHLLEWPVNVARLSLHPRGLAPRIANFAEFAHHLIRAMSRTLLASHDEELAALVQECLDYVPDPDTADRPAHDVVLPMQLEIDGVELTFVSTITTFGAARDVTLSELSIETLYPADDFTRGVLAGEPWLAAVTPASQQ